MQIAGKQYKRWTCWRPFTSREITITDRQTDKDSHPKLFTDFFSDNVQGAFCTNILVLPEGERKLYPNYLPIGFENSQAFILENFKLTQSYETAIPGMQLD